MPFLYKLAISGKRRIEGAVLWMVSRLISTTFVVRTYKFPGPVRGAHITILHYPELFECTFHETPKLPARYPTRLGLCDLLGILSNQGITFRTRSIM